MPRTERSHYKRHLVEYFASTNYPYSVSDIHFKNCVIENIERVLKYTADIGPLQSGTHLGEFTLENVRFTDLKDSSEIMGNAEEPLTIRIKNVTADFVDEAKNKSAFMLDENSHAILIEEV